MPDAIIITSMVARIDETPCPKRHMCRSPLHVGQMVKLLMIVLWMVYTVHVPLSAVSITSLQAEAHRMPNIRNHLRPLSDADPCHLRSLIAWKLVSHWCTWRTVKLAGTESLVDNPVLKLRSFVSAAKSKKAAPPTVDIKSRPSPSAQNQIFFVP